MKQYTLDRRKLLIATPSIVLPIAVPQIAFSYDCNDIQLRKALKGRIQQAEVALIPGNVDSWVNEYGIPYRKSLIKKLNNLESKISSIEKCKIQRNRKTVIAGIELFAGQFLFYAGLVATYGTLTALAPWVILSGVVLSTGLMVAKVTLINDPKGAITTKASANADLILNHLNRTPSVISPSSLSGAVPMIGKALNVFNIVSSVRDISDAQATNCSGNIQAISETIIELNKDLKKFDDVAAFRQQNLRAIKSDLEKELSFCTTNVLG